jgi:EAL domain-containing protein (putative c-di-GMP-specific phosphodiesterase class I)
VAAVGIDRFAHMRGAIGYEFAARVARMVGDRLGDLVSRDKVARLSTEVLGCLVTARDEVGANAVCARLLGQLELPVSIGDETVDLALTIGLAPLAPTQETTAAAIEMANIALDQARAARRKIAFFDARAYGDPASNLSLMSSMLRGLERGEIELFHQPKFDLRKRAVTGVEALVRWRHPTRGMLPPDLFIPMAEETGHIRALTDWVLRRAVQDQRVLAETGHELEMSVNISGRLLGDKDFLGFAVAEAAKAHGKLCFEITETAVIENPDLALEILDAFAEAGISISIDDFGTGLSSLAYLKRIRGEELKIDKSIVQGVTDSRRDALILRSVIDMAHSLGLKVTAEGVETKEMLAALATMGCDVAQGYLIARPQPLTELFTFLDEDKAGFRQYG